MNNHFGKGLMAGLKATHADSAVNVTKFCADYKRGFVLGYSHRMYEKTGDRQLSAWEAGILTRRYGLDKEMVMDQERYLSNHFSVLCQARSAADLS